MLSRVDLPQPDGPTRAMNSPRPTPSDTSRSASTTRPRATKLLAAFLMSTCMRLASGWVDGAALASRADLI